MMIKKLFKYFRFFFLYSFMTTSAFSQEQLKVLTFNTWLLGFDRLTPTLSMIPTIGGSFGILPRIQALNNIAVKDKEFRLQALPQALAQSGADIIALQEIWDTRDVKFVIGEMIKKGYIYSSNPNPQSALLSNLGPGALGNGLLILSKYPMIGPEKMEFSVQTRLDERMTGKGVAYIQIETPQLGVIDFYTLHAGALSADREKNAYNEDHYKKHNTQILEVLDFIDATRKNAVSILAGDLNVHSQQYIPNTFNFGATFGANVDNGAYELINASWIDSYRELHPSLKNSGTVPAFVPRPGALPVADGESVPMMDFPYFDADFFKDERVDYIFYRSNQQNIKPVDSKILFNENIGRSDDGYIYLSDHFGVMTVFEKTETQKK